MDLWFHKSIWTMDDLHGNAPPSPCASGEFRSVRLNDRIVPTSCRRDLFDFAWPPGMRFVWIDRRVLAQYWIDNAPCLFYVILTCKECPVTFHRSAKQSFVRFHLAGAWRA